MFVLASRDNQFFCDLPMFKHMEVKGTGLLANKDLVIRSPAMLNGRNGIGISLVISFDEQ